jgi:hypothetical protein
MKFTFAIKPEKRSEVGAADSPLRKLIGEVQKSLLTNYAGFYRKAPLNVGFVGRRRLVIDAVPKRALFELKMRFSPYAQHFETVRRHRHRWVPWMGDQRQLFFSCGDENCDAQTKILISEPLEIVRKVIAPYLTSEQKYLAAEKRGMQLFLRRGGRFLVDGAIAELTKAVARAEANPAREEARNSLQRELNAYYASLCLF